MKLFSRLLAGFVFFSTFYLFTSMPVFAFEYVIYDCPEGICDAPLYPVPDLSKPEKGVPVLDPNFNTQITRITDKDTDQYISRAILNTYSRNNPVNADGSKIILMGGARYYIYDALTFQLLRRLSQYDGGQIPCCHEIEPRWDATDPNVFYYRSGTQLVKYDYLTDSSTLIRDFSQDFPGAADIYTRTEGAPSRDSRYWAFTARGGYPEYEWVAAFTYDMEEDRVLGAIDTPDPHDTLSISPLGNRVIVDYNWPGQVTSYALDFTDPVEIGTIGHSDLTINSNGRQVRVFEDPSSDWIVMADLETGERCNLLKLPLTGNWATSSGNHISGSNYNTPGWVLMSTYGTMEKTGDTWPFNLMFMLELKENPRIWLIGHTHCPQSEALGRDYWAEAFATIDRQGSKVFWGSNWDNAGAATPIEAYQITLPEDWYNVLSGDGSDLVPPVRSNGQPATTLAVDTNQVSVSLETNENATCKYSISTTRVAYADMVNTFADTGALSHAFTMTGLANGQSYNLYVRCQDEAGNVNIDDFPISFNVASGSEGGELDKVLFIGNSYTGHSGGIQNHFQKMMEESGRTVEVAGEIHGGEAFSYKNENYPGQANRPEVTARIQSNDWDAVVLQSYYEDEQAFYDAGGVLIDRVKNNGSDPILFMIWGHELHPDQDTMFRQRTEQLGNSKETQVAPIGAGIRAAYNAGLPVYLDGGHLSLSGAYMAGAMYYAFFTGESPVGLQYDGFVGSGYFGRLTEEEITPLQELAWQVVNDYGVFWHKEPSGETPPTLSDGHPSGTLPAGTETTTVSLSTNHDATCRYSLNTTHVSYDDMPGSFTTTDGTSHAAELTALSGGTTYRLYVRCRDLSGNTNTVDYPITFSVSASSNSSSLDTILFVGGFYTANAGGIHKHFQKMMEEAGKPVEIADILHGGEPFSHLNDQYPGLANREDVADKISSRQWDAVVLQSQDLRETEDQFTTAGTSLIDKVETNGSKPALFMIWGRKSYPAQDLLYQQRYERLGQEAAIQVVPVGIGIRTAHDQGIAVYNGEAMLSLKGSYLAGAIFYAYFTGESPVGLQYDGFIGSGYYGRLTEEEITPLQKLAWQVVSDYGEFWSGEQTPPTLSNGHPTGTLPVGTATTTVSLSTDREATCRYSLNNEQISYDDMTGIFATTDGTSHVSELTALADGTTYKLYVRCRDASGNTNTVDYPITFTVAKLDKILFVGGFYTANAGGIHKHFQKMMEEAGKSVEIADILHGGEPFSRLNDQYPGIANREDVANKISSEQWDAVILQSQDLRETVDQFTTAGASLIDKVENNGSKPALFMIWGRKSYPAQDLLYQQRYELLGQETATQVVPVGLGIRAAHDQGLEVYNGEAMLNLKGSYLAGAIFYAYFTGESPVGLQYDGFIGSGYYGRLTAEEITPLQELAWQVVGDYGVFNTQPESSN